MSVISGLERRLTLRQLRAVCAIAETGRLLAAGNALGVSQPALTRMLRELEALFEVPLFDRHARGVTPTEYGAALVRSARQILGEITQLESTLNGLQLRQAGCLAVGTLPSAGAGLMPGVLARLQQTRPALDIRMVQGRTDQMLRVLTGAGIELLVGRLYPAEAEDGVVRRVLYDEPLALLVRAGHPLADNPSPTAADLRRYRMVLPTYSQRMAGEVETWLAALDVLPGHALRTSAAAAMREMVLSGDDLLVLPALMLAGDILRGAVLRIAAPVPSPARLGGVMYRHGVPLSEPANFLLRTLRAQIRDLAKAGIIAIR
jgi:LysR family pca operon transcriptional activator